MAIIYLTHAPKEPDSQAGQADIPVTAAMAKAGAEVISAHLEGPLGCPLDELAVFVFQEMARLRHSPNRT